MSDVLVSDTPQGVPTLDISGTTAPPFHRHVGVELRKLVDTRAGKWLLIVMAVLTALVMVIQLIVGLTQDITLRYADFIAGTTYSIGFLLPILAILLLTSEWGQRTAMVTFSLEPNRVKVVLAKLAAACLVAFASVVFAIAFGGLANGLFGALSDTGASWDTSALELGAFLLVQLLAVLTGFALAALFLNTPAAIVVYFAYMFVLPGLFALGAYAMDWFEPVQKWLDFGAAQVPLSEVTMAGEDWARLAVTTTIWVLVPLAVGVSRIQRSEAK